ncbi:MAG TPA: SDR family NAD(P)-dependent oxidoreductase, partial [Dyella sp.]|uniref:SDR family NAD(P)-dependent oxidoreductase n=1 Tax=Dyella sp. TaxID=1869338 RepID=UPI002F923D1E
SYIEAHGTGTSLGDPIEIAGLSKAFGQWTRDRQYCAIGSAKSNIGHCESAAGIAGVTKVLLQLKHRQLAPSLHSSVLNPNIDFSGTPFVVQQTLSPWERPSREGRSYPRIAGISSFGAGGANAHVVIEEYEAPVRADVPRPGPALVVLSARSEERLREQVERLHAFLVARQGDSALRLDDLAYTLQVGREAMDERLGVMTSSLEELRLGLAAYIAGETGMEALYRGQAKRGKEALGALVGDEDMASTVDSWIAKGKLDKLLDLWVRGLSIDWDRLYGEAKPHRISLPTYPFARDRYWIQIADERPAMASDAVVAMLHPLLHRNTSDIQGLRFSTRLTGNEFFLVDHVVQAARILPGVAQLEMACCAAREALGTITGLTIRDVAWVRPIVVGEDGLDLHIALHAEETGELSFEIYSESGVDDLAVYSQGAIAPLDEAVSPQHDLVALRERCAASHMVASQCYPLFERLGLDYGPTFQGLREIFIGSAQALARIELPVGAPTEGYELHPSLLDAALQATLGVQAEAMTGDAATLMLPFALGSLDVLRPCAPSMWAWVRHSANGTAGDKARQLDIDLCDAQGQVCVRFRQFSLRQAAATPLATRATKASASSQTLLLQPMWRSQPASQAEAPTYAQHIVLLGVEADDIERRMPDAVCLRLPVHGTLAERFTQAAGSLLGQLQALGRLPGRHLIQVVVPDRGLGLAMQGLGGMLRTARLESAQINGQLIGIEPDQDVVGTLLENRGNDEPRVRYVNGERQVATWVEYTAATVGPSPWKPQGVYLITGGAGGLGLIFAREIALHAQNPVLILTGRSPMNERIQASIRALETLGAVVRYHAVDVADAAALTQLVQSIPEDFESLNGIIHSAGVVRDSFIARKTPEQLRDVLSAKVAGTLNLDEASRDIPLDCFICFSSVAGAMGNVGQADYAAANAFMDAFAHHRSDLVSKGLRQGRTVSVNWPLWEEGGMQVDAATRTMLAQQLGMQPLSCESGLWAMRQALASPLSQMLVVEGDPTRIREVFLGEPQEAAVAPAARIGVTIGVPGQSDAALPEKLRRALVATVSSLIKVKPEDIDGDTPLMEYGFDSITLTEFSNAMNRQYRLELKPTIFFEYPTLAGLADYLLSEHAIVLAQQFDMPSGTVAATPAIKAEQAVVSVPVSNHRQRQRPARGWGSGAATAVGASPVASRFDVAIVGLSGRYPGAADVHQFWDNLVAGRNSIREVPPERWDNGLVFEAQKQRPGKTYSKWAGLLDDVDCFDRLFFNITPQEAQLISPQERLFMQEVYASIEDAGYTPDTLSASRKIGTFVGVLNESYPTGARYWSIANRISYLLNFQGPSMAVDTACSSSLTAVHLAIESLRSGDSEVAIAGGVNLLVTPDHMIGLSSLTMLSSDDKCKPFAADGDGFVDSEAVGALVLKPLQRAIEDGDHIYGVIKGSAINSGGKTHGYMTPNPLMQAQLVSNALRRAGVDARAISYVEAQGTGSHMGDSIEIAGLTRAFRGWTQDRQFCAIGSVKSNIGHTESASGFVGISKVLMQMKHGMLVPSLHADTLNPNIHFADSPFVVQQVLADWVRPTVEIDGQRREVPRIAGISSFGAGGANAHLVIEEYIAPASVTPVREDSGPVMVMLSARNADRLQAQVRRLLAAIAPAQASELSLVDLAYTLQVGREPMEERLALLVESLDDLRNKLGAYLAEGAHNESMYRGKARRHTMALFSGDEDMAAAVRAWIAKGKFGKLLDLWVQGFNIDWSALYAVGAMQRARRIGLPTYPFARERCWTDVPYPDAPEAHIAAGVSLARGAVPDQVAKTVREIAPAMDREQVMTRIWQDLFGRPSIERDDDFFELGGHSLLATQLVSRIQAEFGVELPVSAVLDAPTVAALSARVVPVKTAQDVSSSIPRAGRDGHLPLSFAQQRLWFLDQYESRREIYNIPVTVQLTGRLDISALSCALNEIVGRHDVLRTTFSMAGDEPVQCIAETVSFHFETIDLSALPLAEQGRYVQEHVQEEARLPFDLTTGPLVRGRLIRQGDERHILLLTMHHIVSDGWSMGVVGREIAALYRASLEGRPSPLSELPLQYADFARWQREWLRGEVLDRQLNYWKQQLAGSPSLLALPTDRPRPVQSSHAGAVLSFMLPSTLVSALKALGQRSQSTLFMTLCAAFNVLLARYSGQTDICVGTPIANRNRADIEGLVGFFVNTLVLRTQVDLAQDFGQLLRQVRQHTLDAYAHQDVPFEQLVEALQPERHTS